MNDHSLSSLLRQNPKSTLIAVARAHGITDDFSSKTDLVDLLAARLSNSDVVHQLLSTLPTQAGDLFERIKQEGGSAGTLALRRSLHGANHRNGDGTRESPLPFGMAAQALLIRGLLFSPGVRLLDVPPEKYALRNVELVIPREVLAAVEGQRTPLKSIDSEEMDRRRDSSAQNFQRDVYLYWNYLRDQPVTLTASGLVPKRHLLRLNEAMIVRTEETAMRDENSAARLHFIRILLEETGLVREGMRGLEPNTNANEFFGYNLTRRTDRFFETWKRTPRWNELKHLPIRPREHEPRSSRAVQVVVRARQYVLDTIAKHATTDWLSVDDLLRRVRRDNYEFLFKRSREEFGEVNPYYYYHNPLGWGFPVGDEREGWDKVESALIRNIIIQPLYWLGLVSLGYAGEELAGFQFNPLGAYLFGLGPQPAADESVATGGRVVVQPNFQIFALEPIAEQTLAALDRFADRVKADKVFEYHLTRESLYRAQQNGMSVADAVAFLQKAATTTLPQNVLRTLEEWGQSYERIIVRRNVALLHVLDSELINRLQADSVIAQEVVSRPLPHVLILKDGERGAEKSMRVLTEAGELPASTPPPDRQVQHDSIEFGEDGKINLLHPLPSIFLVQELERHAERRADGYYLTESIVKAERSEGLSLDQIIAQWQAWHHGPIPPALIVKIRRWGRFYGRARIGKMRFISLGSADVVDTLLEDQEVGPTLHRVPSLASAVFVADADLEMVKAMLEARGIPIIEGFLGEPE